MPASYNGIRTIPIYNYATAFVPHGNNWTWNVSALQPMQFSGFIGQGCAGLVFDYLSGVVADFVIGNLTGAVNANFGNGVWYNGNIYGWCYDSVTTSDPRTFSYPLALGGALNLLTFNDSVPNWIGAITFAPQTFCNVVAITASGGLLSSKVFGATNTILQWNLGSSGSISIPNSYFINTRNANALIPFAGYNFVFTSDNSGGGGPNGICQTDFGGTYITIPTDIINPPNSTLDINTLVNSNASQFLQATYQGWMFIHPDIGTIDGQAFNGFGVLVSPDWTSYEVLKLVPSDGATASWWTALGTWYGKFDQNGYLFMKNVNQNTTVFAGLPASHYIQKVDPPVSLVDPPNDTEIPLTMYEGNGL